MHNWTKSLSKVEKINLGRYGLSPIATLRGVVIDWEYRTWFIAAVWPIERPRRTALLSVLEGWAQVDIDDADGTDEEIMMAPQTGEVGEGLAPKDDIEDVAPRRRRDT
ncbi:hypothetical protein JCGZ_10618 [Jatropha curcas]|uniref:Uncharacterized protein n=1 Tax=Jatropha curcas TaxID=180498 RepID=A0A067KVD9_JATCU|nr:hypothetical protein JCGZ_10618 [Jatropha curcas]